MKHIRLPLTEADIAALQAGDEVLLSGPLYTARDARPSAAVPLLAGGKASAGGADRGDHLLCGALPGEAR